MASAAEAIFERELLQVRLSGGLLRAFQSWAEYAVQAVLDDAAGDLRQDFIRDSVAAAIPEEVADQFAAVFDDFQVLSDALDVLQEVHTYGVNQGLPRREVRRLMARAVQPSRGVFVPTPAATLAQTRINVPALVPAGAPRLPEHPALLEPDVPFAETGHTYATRLETTARTLATTVHGRLARIEAELTGQDLRWVTMGDHRVRSSHRAAQGQTVTYDQWFQVGGIPMEYPGDPAAPEDETINCRCVLTLVKPAERRYVQNYIPRAWLTAAGNPAQARAPKGTPIGGQWIDTPNAILHDLGWANESPDTPAQAYHAPEVTEVPAAVLDNPQGQKAMLDRKGWNGQGEQAIQEYTGSAFHAINGHLRGTPVSDYDRNRYPDPQGMADQIMTGMVPAPSHVVTYRGLMGNLLNGNFLGAQNPDDVVGSVVADKGFFSTTLDPWTATSYAASDAPYMRVIVPKGSPMLWADPASINRGELEMILPPDTPLAITGWSQDPQGRTVYEATVVTPVNPGLTASAPAQARAPKGTPIGGQWIDTPLTLLEKITLEAKGLPVPEEPKYRNAQALADEYKARLEAAWGDPNLEVTINGVGGGDEYGTKFMGVITDQDGNRVGDFERTFYADGHVYHDQFRLEPEYQGRGMGSKMQAVSEDFYRELGYDRIELRAGLDVGAYTWARQGYEFQGQLTAYDVAYYAWDSITGGRVGNVTPEARQQANDIFARAQAEAAAAGMEDTSYIPSNILPAEIAAIGWTPGAEMWPGKEVLLGYEWDGVKHLNPSSVTADAMLVQDRALAVAAIHRSWVPTALYASRPVPMEVPSQYAETEEDVWTAPASDADFWSLVIPVLWPTSPNPSLTAAAPAQARAPKGTPIGGEWIETPGGMLAGIGVRDRLVLGFATERALTGARDKAEAKAAALPEPTDADRAAAAARHGRSKRQGGDDRPGSQRRKVLRQKLLDEFGDGKTCPCLNCGRVLDITTVSMDRIIPGADNGRYVPENLIPMDYDCNRARSDDDFDDMASTWATNPSLPPEPVVPPGTRVRARVSGWARDESGDLDGADDAPSLEGVPEFVDGPLTGQAVPGYFKHIVGGYDVDPTTVEATA